VKINCHCHIFSLDCVPLEFRKRFLLDVRNPVHRYLHWLLRRILPEDCRLEDWLEFVDMPISEIAQRLVNEMDVKGDALKKLRKLLDQLIIVIPRNGLPPLHRVPNPWNTDTQTSGQSCEGRERGEALTWGISDHLIIHVIQSTKRKKPWRSSQRRGQSRPFQALT